MPTYEKDSLIDAYNVLNRFIKSNNMIPVLLLNKNLNLRSPEYERSSISIKGFNKAMFEEGKKLRIDDELINSAILDLKKALIVQVSKSEEFYEISNEIFMVAKWLNVKDPKKLFDIELIVPEEIEKHIQNSKGFKESVRR